MDTKAAGSNRFCTDPAHILQNAKTIALSGANIAVAFWGRGAIDQLSLQSAPKGTRVILNADSGACNPEELRLLKDLPNVQAKNNRRLHAKVLLGRHAMLVGSANFSANGLGFQGGETIGWHEACVFSDDPLTIATTENWFASLWERSEPLDDAVIARAVLARDTLRRHARALAKRQGHNTASIESLEGAPLYIVVVDEDFTTGAERGFRTQASSQKLPSERLDFYEAWPKMPKDALLFAYGAERDLADTEYQGEFDTRSAIRSVTTKDGIKGYPVYKATAAAKLEYGCPTGNLNWTKSINAMVAALESANVRREMKRKPGAQLTRSTDWCFPLYEFLMGCKRYGIPLPKQWN